MMRNTILSKLKSPLHLLIDITSICQLSCKYCSAMPLSGKLVNTHRILKLIEEIIEMEIPYITISGGEPLMHPQIVDIVNALAETNISVTINTNGILLNSSRMINSFRSSIENVNFSVSLDSISKRINDNVRGATEEVLSGIQKALNNSYNVSIKSVVTNINGPHLNEIIKYFYPKITDFGFFRCYPTHQTKKIDSKLPVTMHQYRNYISKLFNCSGNFDKAKIMTQYNIYNKDNRYLFSENDSFCLCLYTKVYIDSDLNVFPCYLSKSKKYFLGNIENLTLNQLWNESNSQRMMWAKDNPHPCKTNLLNNTISTRYQSTISVPNND